MTDQINQSSMQDVLAEMEKMKGSAFTTPEAMPDDIGIAHSGLVLAAILPAFQALGRFFQSFPEDTRAAHMRQHIEVAANAEARFLQTPGGLPIDFTNKQVIADLMNLLQMLAAGAETLVDGEAEMQNMSDKADVISRVNTHIIDGLSRKIVELGGDSALEDALKSIGAVKVNPATAY